MLNRLFASLVLATVVLAVVALSGCSQRGPGMVDAGSLSLSKVDVRGVHIMWADVWQDGADAVVRGSLMPSGVANRRHAGHVRVELLDARGSVVKQACSKTIYVSQRGPGKGTRLNRFEVRLDGTVQAGGRVRVTYHGGRQGCQA